MQHEQYLPFPDCFKKLSSEKMVSLRYSQAFSNMRNVLHFFRLALDAIAEIHV